MRKFTFRQLAASGLVCLSLCSLQPAVAAPSVQAGFSPEGSALQLMRIPMQTDHQFRFVAITDSELRITDSRTQDHISEVPQNRIKQAP